MKEQFASCWRHLKEKLPEVADVRLSTRLKESAACLVADGGGDDGPHGAADGADGPRRRTGGEAGAGAEPDHPAVEALRELHAKDADDPRVEAYARLLYDQAVIAEGSKVTDPAAFARRINELIARDAKRGLDKAGHRREVQW